jgi:hypothetical protein
MVSPTTKVYAGIDVSKGRLEVAVRPVGERFDVPNDDAGKTLSQRSTTNHSTGCLTSPGGASWGGYSGPR